MDFTAELSQVIQSYQAQYMEAQANGASQKELDAIHDAANAYRATFGYTANDDGTKFTVIESYNDNVAAVKANNNNGVKLIESANAQLGNLNIDGDKLLGYAKYGLVGLVIVAILDRIF